VRRILWQLLAAAVLLTLLAVLGVLQYRWLGAVSEAERERMRSSLRARAADVALEFDTELTRAYAALHPEADRLDADVAVALTEAYERWRTSASQPGLIRAIYFVDGRSGDEAPQQFDFAAHTLAPAEWPADVRTELKRAHAGVAAVSGLAVPMLVDAVNARIPALVITMPRVRRSTTGAGQTMVVADAVAFARSIVVILDRDRLVRDILEPIVARHFGEPATSDYIVTIAPRDDPKRPVFSSIAPAVDEGTPDLTVGLFDLRLEQLGLGGPGRGASALRRPSERLAITIVRRGDANATGRMVATGSEEGGAWQLRVRHRSGSLDSLVAASRRRNVAVGIGVLGLLAASVGLVIVSAQRQRRIARQQMEFVAAVSHELRTPLAVICSAGENLADGLVSDPSQIKRYGSLVETEGRRLSGMVERVLDFAGIESATGLQSRGDVDVSTVIADAVRGLDADARDRGVTIAVQQTPEAPHVTGDRDALRSAVQNIVGNAVKYSPRGGTVDVATEVRDSVVRISVVDRGLGIDAEDLPHIFKPFYRGRRAIGAEVRGTGVGLSVVRHVVDAHHGRIHVESVPGDGTTVVVELQTGT